MNPDKNQNARKTSNRSPWAWIPTLYIAEGLPLVMVMTVSIIMYTRMGVSLSKIGFWTSLLGFAWTIKPLWGPLVELYWTKRRWSVLMQILMGILLGVAALTLRTDWWWQGSLFALAIVALFSATHDIAADGFYMDALDEKQQSFFVGIRSTFYRIAMIFGQGVLIIIAGTIEESTGPNPSELMVLAAPAGTERVVETPQSKPGFVKFEPASALLDAGTTVSIMVSLNQQPDTTRTVTLRRVPSSILSEFFPIGDEQNVSLTDRKFEVLQFSPGNWNAPQEIVIKADNKLEGSIAVPFKAASGNIPLTWALCFGGVGLLMLSLGTYHMLSLPKPLADGASVTPTTPFSVALSVMALVVAVPVALYFCLYYLILYGVVGLSEQYKDSWFAVPQAYQMFVAGGVVAVLATLLLWTAKRHLGVTVPLFIITLVVAVLGFFPAYFGLMGLNSHGSDWLLLNQNRDFALSEPVLKFLTMGLVVLFVWLVLRSAALKAAVKNAFAFAARVSQVPFDEVFASFFAKPAIGRMVAFLLLYRLGEGLLLKMATPFLLTPVANGGLGLSTKEIGLAYGTMGIFAMIGGGILGGILASRYGLKRWILLMCIAINVPDLFYVYLAYYQPPEFWKVCAAVAGESFGYGFGFTGYMLYMLYIAGGGKNKTSHFALCTGFMSLGMLLPGMVSGEIAETLVKSYAEAPNIGWTWFFVVVCLATIPGFLMLGVIPLDKEFGRRSDDDGEDEQTV